MIQDKDLAYIQHILECIKSIKIYAKNGKTDFDNNMMAQDAIL